LKGFHLAYARLFPGSSSSASLQLVEDFAEFPGAGFACDPLCGTDCAEREAFAAVCVVAEFEDVVGAGSGYDVLAFGVAYAVRRDFDVDAGLSGLDDFSSM
jgi:hypothetical protein